MRCDVRFFAGLDGIEAPFAQNVPFRFFDNFELTADRNYIRRIVGPYEAQLGAIEFKYISNAVPLLATIRFDIDLEEDELKNLHDSASALNQFCLTCVQNFFIRVWSVSDNAVCDDRGWLFISYTDYTRKTLGNSLHLNAKFFRANGSSGVYLATKSDFIAARESMHEGGNDLPKNAVRKNTLKVRGGSKISEANTRFSRFQHFIYLARTTDDIPLKITSYCSALEALLSSSHNEIVHQIAERAAYLIESEFDQRLALYRKVKKAYAIRSKAVHGAQFNNREELKIQEDSICLDDLCRKLFRKVLEEEKFEQFFSKSEEDFNREMLEIVLGKTF